MSVPSRRAAAGVALLGLLVTTAACSGDDEDKDAGKLKANCTQIRCDGTRDGANYKLELPPKWNGTLLIYSHGYRQAQPAPPDNTPVDTSASDAPSPEVAQDLLAQGYALLGSSYKSNGWAVLDGVEANEDLYRWFLDEVGTPARTYVWGHSMGGLITQTFAEKHPDWVDGVIPMCGVLAGTNMNLDLALDVTYAVKHLGIYPDLKLTGYASFEEAVQNFQGAYDAILAATRDVTGGVPRLLTVAALVDASPKTKTYDAHDAPSSVAALVESLVTAVGYGTFARWEIEQRVGGNPSTNVGVVYADRIPPAERSGLLALTAGDKLDGYLAELDSTERIAADAAPRKKADGLGNPRGDVKDPTITLHTQYDPLVLVQNERVFADRVFSSKDREADLVQLYTAPPATYESTPPDPNGGAPYGAGHCNFTRAEHLGVVALLDSWVQSGVPPAAGRIAEVFPAPAEGQPATHGISTSVFPPAWPAAAAS
ncbi:MAG TPA: alpha/beta fold hydrolase [Mycobacteriales bacterium]|nr:alpha/beta fold hydrolase [Mycobacteriales bacterium]